MKVFPTISVAPVMDNPLVAIRVRALEALLSGAVTVFASFNVRGSVI